MTSRWMVPIALAFGLAGGWLLAGSGEPEGSEAKKGHAGKSERKGERGWSMSHVPAGARAMTRRVTEGRTKKDRMRAAIELANSIPVDQIETWLDETWYDTEEGRVDMVYYDILYGRFLEAYPERFMKRCLRKEIDRMGEYMKLWTERDPGAASDFIRSLKDKNQIQSLGDDYLEALGRSNPDLALELISDWSRRFTNKYWLSDAVAAIAKTNRAKLLESLDSWPYGLQNQARQQVGLSWLREDFNGGLQWLTGQRNGSQLFSQAMDNDPDLAGQLLNHLHELPSGWMDRAISSASYELVRSDPLSWLEIDAEALGASESSVRRLRSAAISRIGSRREHRTRALALAAPGGGLDEKLRRNLVLALAGSWDRNDHAAVEPWLASLGDEEIAQAGRESFERSQTRSSHNSAIGSPSEVVAQMASEDSNTFSNFYRLRYWTASHTQEAREAFTNLSPAERDRAAQSMVTRGSSYVSPGLMGESLGHLLATEPVDSKNPEQERANLLRNLSEHASRWGRGDPHSAAEWAEGLAGREERELAARNVYRSWARYEPTEAQRWIDGLGVSVIPPREER